MGWVKYKIGRLLRRAGLIARYWLPAIVWAVVLVSESGPSGSANVTGGWLARLIPFLSPFFEPMHVIIRKAVHVVAYGFLGWLNFRAVRGPRRGWMLRWSIIAVILVIVVASIDEFHQSFFPDRTGTPLDVIVDVCGATLAQLVWRRFSGSPEISARVS